VEEKIQACGLDQLTKLTYDKNPEERAGYEWIQLMASVFTQAIDKWKSGEEAERFSTHIHRAPSYFCPKSKGLSSHAAS
jgi:hypothetical protein